MLDQCEASALIAKAYDPAAVKGTSKNNNRLRSFSTRIMIERNDVILWKEFTNNLLLATSGFIGPAGVMWSGAAWSPSGMSMLGG